MATTTRVAGGKRNTGSRVQKPAVKAAPTVEAVEALVERLGETAVVQRTEQLLAEGEQKALELAQAGRANVNATFGKVRAGYEDLAERVLEQGEALREQVEAQARTVVQSLRAVPTRVEDVVDVALDKVGLVRKSVHEAELARLRQQLSARSRKRKSGTRKAA